jgi:ABC-type multidrug transport system permease subunit
VKLQTAWVLARKDLKLYSRDRTALLLSLMMPICLTAIFGLAMGAMGAGDRGIGRVKLLVENLDESAESIALVNALQGSEALKVELHDGARKLVTDGKAPAALLIPSGYGEDLREGRKPQLKLFRDPSQTIEQQVIAGSLLPALVQGGGRDLARGMMRRGMKLVGVPDAFLPQADALFDQTWNEMHSLASRANAPGEVRMASDPTARSDKSAVSEGKAPSDKNARDGRPSGSTSSEPESALLGDDAASSGRLSDESKKVEFDFSRDLPNVLGVETEDVAGGRDKSQKIAAQAHAVSGIAVMMLLFGLVACGGTLLEEQAGGTMQRLQLAGGSSASILAGKFLYCALAGAIQLVVLFAFGGLVFAVPVFRDPLAIVATSTAVLCAATGLGLLLAATCRTRKQLDGLSTLVILMMSAMGGSWFPLIVTPEWYQRLGHLTLNAWAMDAFQGIFWYGKGLPGIWIDLVMLFAIGAAASFVAVRVWKRRLETA